MMIKASSKLLAYAPDAPSCPPPFNLLATSLTFNLLVSRLFNSLFRLNEIFTPPLF